MSAADEKDPVNRWIWSNHVACNAEWTFELRAMLLGHVLPLHYACKVTLDTVVARVL